MRIEKVQRYFTRRLCSRIGSAPLAYQDRLRFFVLDSLQLRRQKIDLTFYYKLLNDMLPIEASIFFVQTTVAKTRGHSKKLFIQDSRVDVRKYSFACRAVSLWNSLPENIVSAPSLQVFKNRLDSFLPELDHS